jgi:hypothetical protein
MRPIAVDANLPFGLIGRFEKREPQNVIPVLVAEQQADLLVRIEEAVSQYPESASRIQH